MGPVNVSLMPSTGAFTLMEEAQIALRVTSRSNMSKQRTNVKKAPNSITEHAHASSL